MSKVSFCLCIYGASNLLKIGVIIYSNVITLKLKYCPVCIYDCSPVLVPHLMVFHGFGFSMVICHENWLVVAGKQLASLGAQSRMLLLF